MIFEKVKKKLYGQIQFFFHKPTIQFFFSQNIVFFPLEYSFFSLSQNGIQFFFHFVKMEYSFFFTGIQFFSSHFLKLEYSCSCGAQIAQNFTKICIPGYFVVLNRYVVSDFSTEHAFMMFQHVQMIKISKINCCSKT